MHHRRSSATTRRAVARCTFAALATLAAASLAACGSDGGDAGPGTPSTAGTTAGTTAATTAGTTAGTTPAGRGWIGVEPDWSSVSDDATGAAPSDARDGDDTASAGAAAPDAYTSESGAATGLPRAGSVDDNADLPGFLDYLARYEELGFASRPYDPTGRIVLTVSGADGLPVSGADVAVSAAGEEVAQLQTSADGQVVFLPAMYGTPQPAYTFAAGGATVDVSVDAAAGTTAALTLASDGGAAAGMPVDVLFLLDVTGSMGDEIDQLKATIATVADQLRALPQQPDIRFGMTLYRDEGDTFVTSTYDFTGDIAEFQGALADVVADGGGDTPEALDEAFAVALGEPSWRDPAATVQLVFLVADAAPHVERQLEQAYPQSILEASRRGITVHAIAASSTDDEAEHAFREIAQGTGGRFVFLAYGAGGTATGEHTDISSTDYEELSLDQLVVRLVGEELAALTGEPFVPPTTVPGTIETVPSTQQ